MTLINSLLALGGLAFTIPLAIHLFYRSRFRTVDWGAMHLIEGMMQTNRRSIQWMNLLLLLIRLSIPVLLAFCLARPLLTGFQALPGDSAQTVLIAIDDSRSMGFATSGGRVRIDDARQAINRVLDSLTRRDEIIFIRSSDPRSPITRIGPAAARPLVKSIVPHSGPIDLARFIKSATDAAKQAAEPNPRVILVSDFQNNMINDASLDGLKRIAESVKKLSDSDPGQRPVFEFLNVAAANSDAQPANVSIDTIAMESAAAVVGRRVRLSARVFNHGDDPVQGANLVWSVDGRRETPRPITIPERSFVSAKFDRVFENPGQIAVRASIEFPDALAADNRRTLAVNVIKQADVWLVDDANHSRFLEVALSPFAWNSSRLTDPVRTTRIATSDLITQLPESNPDVIVLAGMSAPTKRLRQIVGDYVVGGGSAMIFNLSDAKPDSINRAWGNTANAFQLPAHAGDSVGSDSPDGPLFPLAPRNAGYSPWALFGDASRDLFSDVQVSGYRRLSLLPKSTQHPPTTLVSLASGDPLIVLSKQGQGRIVQFAIAADAKGSTLPLRPVFVPMMQQMVLDLAGSRRRLNLMVGEPLVVLASQQRQSDQRASDREKFWMTPPGEDERSIQTRPSADGRVLSIPPTSKPGVYRFRSSDDTRSIRVLEVPSSESVWRSVNPTRLENAAESLGATIYRESQSLVDDNRVRRYGREVWRWVLSALLVAMIAELWFSQRLGLQTSRRQMEPVP